MNITLSLEDELVKEVRKIAVERDTTLTGLVRSYLRDLAARAREVRTQASRTGKARTEFQRDPDQRGRTNVETRRPV